MASVKYDTLQKLINSGVDSPFLQARLDYIEVTTLLNQHVKKMVGIDRCRPNMLSPQASGRVGLSDPPLGNFTADLSYGPHGLRDVVCPDPGRKWICADWNAVEGWIVSHRSQDRPDLEVKRRGLDLHTVTACRMFKYPDPPGEPTKDWLASSYGEEWRAQVGFTKQIRDGVKNVRYSMNYAKKPYIAEVYAVKLGFKKGILTSFANEYFRSKPWLVRWKEQRWAEAWKHKCSWTAFGRRRRLFGQQYKVEKEGLNHEVQGTVADMMKLTMVALGNIGCKMVLQRHDGFYHDVPEDWDDMDSYKSIVEREWVIDGRPISFPAEYEIWKTK